MMMVESWEDFNYFLKLFINSYEKKKKKNIKQLALISQLILKYFIK